MKRRHGAPSLACVFGAAALAVATPARAQSAGDGFLFTAPSRAVTLRGGVDRAMAGSDLFAFVTDELTLDRRDFSSVTLGIDVEVALTSRVRAVFGVGYANSTTPSEFRHFIDTNDQPIQQTTEFRRVPLAASLKCYLVEPGRMIGRLAWIPARVAPYVGAGGGTLWYRFHQDGDFVDVQTKRVFSDQFDAHGWAPLLQAFAGADVTVTPHIALVGDARYVWAGARLSGDFSTFNRLDLSGLALTGGLAVRY